MRDDEDNFATEPPPPEPPTGARHAVPPHYAGEPEPPLLTRIHEALVGPNGELSKIRQDVNGLINAIQRRQQADEANWNFFKSELSATRHDVKRVEEKLDRIDARVVELERKLAAHETRLAAIESRLAHPSDTTQT